MIEGGKTLIRQEDYAQWPLFRGFRETVQFKNAYKQIFNKDFQGAELSTNNVIGIVRLNADQEKI